MKCLIEFAYVEPIGDGVWMLRIGWRSRFDGPLFEEFRMLPR